MSLKITVYHLLPVLKSAGRKATLTDAEVITILISFQGGQFRNFKHSYYSYVCHHLRDCFRNSFQTFRAGRCAWRNDTTCSGN